MSIQASVRWDVVSFDVLGAVMHVITSSDAESHVYSLLTLWFRGSVDLTLALARGVRMC